MKIRASYRAKVNAKETITIDLIAVDRPTLGSVLRCLRKTGHRGASPVELKALHKQYGYDLVKWRLILAIGDTIEHPAGGDAAWGTEKGEAINLYRINPDLGPEVLIAAVPRKSGILFWLKQ